ncbi:MAG: malonyl-CoA decarboxylase [Aliidongia sp.]
MARSWFDRLLSSIADRGRAWVKIPTDLPPLDQVRSLAESLLSEKGEASGAALARALIERYRALGPDDQAAFHLFLSEGFAPDFDALRAAAEHYIAAPSAEAATQLAERAEPPRQELLRRINMGPGGTATLVGMREAILGRLKSHPTLAPLESDLQHLFASWFNRGFLELRRIDWHTPAAILEKLIAYEAVHAIQGWDDLRRRVAADRRCFAFFHPALIDEPLIFVEVALVNGLAGAIQPLLATPDPDRAGTAPDTAIFYSISNCQRGLRGISFGNFLIKQVVEELKQELPSLNRFATLSPMPGFRGWLERRLAASARYILKPEERDAIATLSGGGGTKGALRRLLAEPGWQEAPATAAALKGPLMRLCAAYLTENLEGKGPADPVARFHLGNGACLEQINWLANPGKRGLKESFGLMVNYLYDLDRIEANHEAFVRLGQVAHSDAVAELLREERGTGRSVGNLLSFTARRAPRVTTLPREAAP